MNKTNARAASILSQRHGPGALSGWIGRGNPAAWSAGDHGSASLTAGTRPRASPVATWPLPGKLVRNKALGEVSEWKGQWLRPPTACQPLNYGGPVGVRVTTATPTAAVWRWPNCPTGPSPSVIRAIPAVLR